MGSTLPPRPEAVLDDGSHHWPAAGDRPSRVRATEYVPMFDYTLPESPDARLQDRFAGISATSNCTADTRSQWTSTWLEDVLNYDFANDTPAASSRRDESNEALLAGPSVQSLGGPRPRVDVVQFPLEAHHQGGAAALFATQRRPMPVVERSRPVQPWDSLSASPSGGTRGSNAAQHEISPASTTIHNMWGLILALEAGGSSVRISAPLMRQLLRAAGQGVGRDTELQLPAAG